jgi:hypothetical protein
MRNLLLFAAFVFAGCKSGDTPPPDDAKGGPAPAEVSKPAPALNRVLRGDFNRIAAELFLPLFWTADTDADSAIDPDELAVLWGIGSTTKGDWVSGGAFAPKFLDAYEAIASGGVKVDGLEPKEAERRALMKRELDQGRPTLVQSSFASATDEDKAIVRSIMEAAVIIERIHAKQNGIAGLESKIPAGDTASMMVMARNQGPWCEAPETESNATCNAIPDLPKKMSGLYPASLQERDPAFCENLAKRKDGEALLHQFHVVAERDGNLAAVPYTEAYKDDMEAVAAKLEAAGAAIASDGEASFKAYLTAAATAFRTNQWELADEAWAKMSVKNSKWYLRIGPDEVYFEPCSRKAGFHVSFARINEDSLEWQNKLDPVKTEMEQALAKLAGAPYKARKVDFHLPDFIDIILNAGDSRPAHGATIGQSLPNWGPVANEGRGRTVAMTNLYADPDSRESLEAQAKSVLCEDTMKRYTRDPKPQIMSTVLHEAAHNLGPAHEYKVKGKTASQIFGGPLASTLEELKAQSAALYYTDWLAAKKLIAPEMADQAHVRDVVWAFGHISRGMYSPDGKPKPYSQLAAIQVGFLRKEGAIEWKADQKAANAEDMGCVEIHAEKVPAAVEKLMKTVAAIKGKGDAKGAQKLVKEMVDDKADKKKLLDVVTERWLRAPKASFVYAVDL